MFGDIRAVAFDLDGTIYTGGTPIPGAKETVSELEERGYRILFCTNNSGSSRSQIASKLGNMGISCGEEQIFSSGWATLEYLRSMNASGIWAVGTDAFVREISERFETVEVPEEADVLVVGFDPRFDYGRLTAALRAATACRTMIFCNEDPFYTGDMGRKYPGCGGMTHAVSGCSGRQPDFVVGKPAPYMMSLIGMHTGLRPESILVVGDSYDSDVCFAKNSGAKAILISDTGHGDVHTVEDIRRVPEILGTLPEMQTISTNTYHRQ